MELQEFLFSWRHIEIRRAATAMAFKVKTQLSLYDITKVLMLHRPNLRWIWFTCFAEVVKLQNK